MFEDKKQEISQSFMPLPEMLDDKGIQSAIYVVTQLKITKSVKFCYVQLVENQATVFYNNHINQIFGGFYDY